MKNLRVSFLARFSIKVDPRPLLILVEAFFSVVDGSEKLCFTDTSFAKAMSAVCQDFVVIEMRYNVDEYYMFNGFA